ncbi:MAG: hypothetical protein ABEJ89_01125 [Haloarculaceae archaeon]
MRRVTRRVLVGLLVVVVLLLALGALPSYIRSGDPYYMTATPAAGNHTAVNATGLSDRYPYTNAALADATATDTGRADPYWRGPVGFKEAFTHSPFDELAALGQHDPAAREGDAVYVTANGTLYRLSIQQDQQ